MGTTDTNHELAKCLSSAIVSIDVDCKVSINATATDNSFVQALWSSDAGSYKQLKLCPATSAKAVFDTDAAKSLALAFNGYIYGFNSATPPAALKESGVTGVTFPAAGRMVVAFGTSDTLTYAIRAKSATTSAIHATNAVVVTDGTTSGFDTTEFKSADDAGLDCDAGRYGMLVGDIKLCPLCPAGTTGDGNGCTACPAGKASDAVGVTDTTGCTAVCHQGYFSQTGEHPLAHALVVAVCLRLLHQVYRTGIRLNWLQNVSANHPAHLAPLCAAPLPLPCRQLRLPALPHAHLLWHQWHRWCGGVHCLVSKGGFERTGACVVFMRPCCMWADSSHLAANHACAHIPPPAPNTALSHSCSGLVQCSRNLCLDPWQHCLPALRQWHSHHSNNHRSIRRQVLCHVGNTAAAALPACT